MQTLKVSTKADKDSAAKETVLSVDWHGITEQQLQAGYLAYMVVKVQGVWRRGGIPATASIKASDFAPGTRHSAPTDPRALLAALSPEERAKIIAEFSKQ